MNTFARSACFMFAASAVILPLTAQTDGTLHPHPEEKKRMNGGEVKEPGTTYTDPQTRVTFDVPAGWDFSRKDGELSTFHLDARNAPSRAKLRAVAALSSNPFPDATFSGALFYFSRMASTTKEQCSPKASRTTSVDSKPVLMGDMSFTRGFEQRGRICTEARDTIYTTWRHGVCLRFDLVLNSFCGGDVTGVKDMTSAQLADVQKRLEGILQTIRFTDQ